MLEIKDLSFSYGKAAHLFEQLSFNVKPGHICGLLGKNGAGKTTLMQIVAGLRFAHEGSAQVLGFDAAKRQQAFLKNIYFITEEIHLPAIKAGQYTALYAPFYEHFDHKEHAHFCQKFDVPMNKVLTELSYGQRKKFAIAFALATRCPLLLLDEPTNGLDIPSKSQFRKLVAESLDETRSMIISTHQVHDVENMIDHVVILDHGEIALSASLEEIGRTLLIKTLNSEEAIKHALYSEQTVQGCRGIIINDSREESEIDFELLFNAVLENKGKIKKLFRSSHHAS